MYHYCFQGDDGFLGPIGKQGETGEIGEPVRISFKDDQVFFWGFWVKCIFCKVKASASKCVYDFFKIQFSCRVAFLGLDFFE